MFRFLTRLKEWFWGRTDVEQPERTFERIDSDSLPTPPPPAADKESGSPIPTTTAPPVRDAIELSPLIPSREPYFIQIGFDFGTAYCKCICRDIFLNKAWIHFPPSQIGTELPFLIPTTLHVDDQDLTASRGDNRAQSQLRQVKMALERAALGQWEDTVLAPFRLATKTRSLDEVARLVEMTAIYLLSGAIGTVRDKIAERYPGHVDGDYLAINMAVPVADVDHPATIKLFEKILRSAWVISDHIDAYPTISIEELAHIRDKHAAEIESASVREACYVYPEVSANVQGFIRSRTSNPGIYLFSDAGAGTVDQSLFIFYRNERNEFLTYLNAQVLPLGSGLIERTAANISGDASDEAIERWCLKKEANEYANELEQARTQIGNTLSSATGRIVAAARRKMPVQEQMNDLRVIFGGGGHCDNPYRRGVLEVFSGETFPQAHIQHRRDYNDPFEIGMPPPPDLDLPEGRMQWIDRLTVAYGLSFLKDELAKFWLPNEIESPTQFWPPKRRIRTAPSKDEV